jgi:8-oxo-dGTP pyrophosphatase MutT (NUDIX family)
MDWLNKLKCKVNMETSSNSVLCDKENEGFRCAGIILYRIKDNVIEYVLVETHQKRYQYSFPKGKRESNETTLENAKRETREETGLNDDQYTIIPNKYFIEYLKKNNVNKKHIKYYVAKVLDNNVTFLPQDLKEIKDCNWFTLEQILTFDKQLSWQRRSILVDVDRFLKKYNLDGTFQ